MERKLMTNKTFKISISKKERNLLLIFFITLFFWLSYRFVFMKQLNDIDYLNNEKANLMTQISNVKEIISKDSFVKNEEKRLLNEINKFSKKYYYSINQPDILHILNKILEEEQLKITNINFSEPEAIDYEGLEGIYSIDISLPFTGEYEDLESFLHRIKNSSKYFLIDYLSITRNGEDNFIDGQISLKAFCYGNDKVSNSDYYYVNAYSGYTKLNPFQVFEGYDENASGNDSNPFDETGEKRDLIFDMESNHIYFMGTSPSVSGNLKIFNEAKFGKTSIRTEYYISTNFKSERAYITLDDKELTIKYPPQHIGIWAYAYSYSPVTVGMRFKDMDGNKIDVELSKGVNWKGWNYISAMPPQDVDLYPLKLDRIYMELEPNREDYGVILFDQVEASYIEDGETQLNESENYTFYIVKSGDTLKSISKNFYNTESKYMDLARENALNPSDDLEPGNILVIPK